jgi:hypothetical protein
MEKELAQILDYTLWAIKQENGNEDSFSRGMVRAYQDVIGAYRAKHPFKDYSELKGRINATEEKQ